MGSTCSDKVSYVFERDFFRRQFCVGIFSTISALLLEGVSQFDWIMKVAFSLWKVSKPILFFNLSGEKSEFLKN